MNYIYNNIIYYIIIILFIIKRTLENRSDLRPSGILSPRGDWLRYGAP